MKLKYLDLNQTALLTAVEKDNIDLVKILLSSGSIDPNMICIYN